jgi:hypothetical protein
LKPEKEDYEAEIERRRGEGLTLVTFDAPIFCRQTGGEEMENSFQAHQAKLWAKHDAIETRKQTETYQGYAP